MVVPNTWIISKLIATIAVKNQFVRPAKLIAKGRGPWRNNSAPTIIGMGPAAQQHKNAIS